MNDNKRIFKPALLLAMGLALGLSPLMAPVQAAEEVAMMTPTHSVEFAPQITATLGKSTLIKLPVAASRVSVGDKEVADVVVLNPREIYLLGRKVGTTNLVMWDKAGQSTVVDVVVAMDANALQGKLVELLPSEKGIRVSTAADTMVLTGTVADAVKVDKALMLAEAYSGKKVVNMLRVGAPQQVLLEVKMAEVSKNLLDKLGAQFNASRTNGGVAYAIAAGFLSLTGANPLSPGGLITITHDDTVIKLDAEDRDGIVKILAEPNIMAISGQEGSFLAGGKLFIPVSQAVGGVGVASAITLEEKEFGVGLRFTPTVLEDGLINLRVAPEVSELSQSGTEIIASGGRSVLPSFTVRRAETTVQLRDGQSFAIAGLIKNNVTETIRRFPILGEIPILGALFRSSEFQNDLTELLFVITPRLVKPLPPNYALPTDNFNQPSKSEFFLHGKLEGKPKPDEGAAATTQPSTVPPAEAGGGYEMK